MPSRMLVKANNDLVTWCQCDRGVAGYPFQAGCPWCGCGWLFTCVFCRRAFTFATVAVVPESLDDLAVADLRGFGLSDPGREDRRMWHDWMTRSLRDTIDGASYVYFDGHVVPVDAGSLTLTGWYASHDLFFVPQVEALSRPAVCQDLLSNRSYWLANAHEK